MSSAGYFLARVLLSAFSLLFFSERVPIRFGPVYLVITAGFVADQLIM